MNDPARSSATDNVGLPFVISLPHCGTLIPTDLRKTIALTDTQIADSVDLGTREIFGGLPVLGVVAAEYNRLVVDLNRAPDNRGERGVVCGQDYHGRPVYHATARPTDSQIQSRVELFHRPFHALLERRLEMPGVHGLLDCHSLSAVGPPQAPDTGRTRRDIILSNNGDSRGNDLDPVERATCDVRTMQSGVNAFQAQGFTVAVNHPYRGAYIVKEYGRRLRREDRFAIQIEINQKQFVPSGSAIADPALLRGITHRVLAALTLWAQALT